jgi:hypothetical protein
LESSEGSLISSKGDVGYGIIMVLAGRVLMGRSRTRLFMEHHSGVTEQKKRRKEPVEWRDDDGQQPA